MNDDTTSGDVPMTGNGQNIEARQRARLQTVLDAYGADPARWPEQDRSELASLLEQDTELSDLIGGVRALDRVLDHATAPQARDGAVARILAAATADEDGTVIPLDAARTLHRDTVTVPQRVAWPVAALMAASLLVGAFLGQTDFLTGNGTGTFLTADTTFDEIDDALLGLSSGVIPFTEETL